MTEEGGTQTACTITGTYSGGSHTEESSKPKKYVCYIIGMMQKNEENLKKVKKNLVVKNFVVSLHSETTKQSQTT